MVLFISIGHFWENLVPEIWAKTLLANQIAGFLDQLNFWKKRDEIA